MAAISTSKNTPQSNSNKYLFPLATFTLLFFSCGLITSMNDVLIPKLKSSFDLNYFQSMLVQFCFFFAYFIVSAIYYLLSLTHGNLIMRIGYKNIIFIGLLTSATGSLLFYPACSLHSYPSFLAALFVLASGMTLLQIGANPYVTLLGSPETASGRLNLVQAFNSLGCTIAPLIGGKLILDVAANQLGKTETIEKTPYLIISLMLLLIALALKITQLPKMVHRDEKGVSTYNHILIKKYRHLKYGIIAIFMYVGGEVSIGSVIIIFLEDSGITEITYNQGAQFLSLYWGGAMIGRFFGAIFLSKMDKKTKFVLVLTVLTGAFYYSGAVTNFNPDVTQYFWVLIILNVGAFFIGANIPHRTLSVFSLFVIASLFIGALSSSTLATWAIIGIGLFNSIMFPSIFSLAVRDLHRDTPRGSSLLIMGIVGGAIIPLIQGKLADMTNVQLSFLAPVVCYVYLFFYGINGYKKQMNKNQNLWKSSS